MKMKEVKNKRVVSALMIGISAMMALQTPITAYANDNGSENPPAAPEPPESAATVAAPEAPYTPVTAEAQQEASDVQEVVAGEQPAAPETPAPEATATPETPSTPETTAAPETPSTSEAPTTAETPTTPETPEAPSAPAAPEIVVQNESAMAEAKEAADQILKGDETVSAANANDGGALGGAAIEKLIDAAEDITIDEDNDPSALSSFEEAAKDITSINNELKTAENANKTAEEAYVEATNATNDSLNLTKDLNEAAADTASAAKQASETAAELVNAIASAETKIEAQSACDKLTAEIANVEGDLNVRKEYYSRLTSNYLDAIDALSKAEVKLRTAEKTYDEKLDSANDILNDITENVAAAKQKVDNLATALANVEKALAGETQNADNLIDNMKDARPGWQYLGSGTLDDRRNLMKEVVSNYYLPQIMEYDVVYEEGVSPVWSESSVKNVDRQEFNYTWVKFKYRDTDGTIKEATKYFNWDGYKRRSTDTDPWKDIETNGNDGIVVYEKTEDEVKAGEHLMKLAETDSELRNVLKNNNAIKDVYKQGKTTFTVYVYEDSEGKHYLAHSEAEALKASGEVTFSTDGVPLEYNGHALKKVVQNQNNLLHEGNCLIVSHDELITKYTNKNNTNGTPNSTNVYARIRQNLSQEKLDEIAANSHAFNEFVRQTTSSSETSVNLVNKYKKYAQATAEATAKAQAAENEVAELTNAIQALNGTKQSRVIKATEALGVTDIATFFNLDVDSDKADQLNNMAVNDLINELKALRDNAKKNLDQYETLLENLKTDLNNSIALIAAMPDPTASSGGGEVTTGGGGTATTGGGGGAATATPIDGTEAVTSATGPVFNPNVTLATTAPALVNVTAAEATVAPIEGNATTIDGAAAIGGDVANAGAVQPGGGDIGDAVQPGGGDNTVQILDEDTARADAPETITVENPTPTQEAAFTITDEDSAKAATFDISAPEKKMSWWWVLIIAVLGATGEEMYRRHLLAAKKRDDDEDNENNTTL